MTSERFRPPGVTLEVRHSSGSAGDHTDEWYTYDLSVDTAKPLQEVEIADEATGNFARGVRRNDWFTPAINKWTDYTNIW